MGDAVTGINRADSASEKSHRTMLRQHYADCTIGQCCDRLGLPIGQVVCLKSVSPADRLEAVAGQTAYPPPRESCVRCADRAAVGKRFRSSLRYSSLLGSSSSAWLLRCPFTCAQNAVLHACRSRVAGSRAMTS